MQDAKKKATSSDSWATLHKEMMTCCYQELQELIVKYDASQERFLEENGPDYERLCSKIPKLQDATTTEWTNFFMQTLTHSAVLPVTVYQHIVQLHPAVASTLNDDEQLALHVAVDCRDPIPALVETLLQAAPHTAMIREQNSGLLPIEIVTSHILAKEEAERYQNRKKHRLKSASSTRTVNLIRSDANWECVRLLAIRHAILPQQLQQQQRQHCQRDPNTCSAHNNGIEDSIPVLHACLAAPNIPMSLTEKAIRRFPQQAAITDECTGNFPLHIVARQRRTTEDVLVAVLKLHPAAAQQANHSGCLPLDLAIAARRTWTTGGVGALVEAFPAGLGLRGRFPSEHYPLVLSELLSRACPNTCFALLQASSNFL